MKTTIILFLAMISISLNAQDQDLTKIKRDIDILTSALKTSLSYDDPDRSRRDHDFLGGFHIDGTYLKHQGVLLTIGMSHHGSYFLGDLGDVLIPLGELEMPEIPEIPEITSIEFLDEDEYEEVFEAMEDAMDEAADVIHDMEDINSEELRREMSELKRMQREELRRTRERYRESREEFRRKESLSEKEREEIMAQLEARKAEIEQTTKKYQAKITALKAQQRKEWESRMAKIEQTMVEILCDYGSAMRALPDDEHITIMFANGEMNPSGRFQDKIFVFKKQDLTACRNGSIDPKTLMEKGSAYAY